MPPGKDSQGRRLEQGGGGRGREGPAPAAAPPHATALPRPMHACQAEQHPAPASLHQDRHMPAVPSLASSSMHEQQRHASTAYNLCLSASPYSCTSRCISRNSARLTPSSASPPPAALPLPGVPPATRRRPLPPCSPAPPLPLTTAGLDDMKRLRSAFSLAASCTRCCCCGVAGSPPEPPAGPAPRGPGALPALPTPLLARRAAALPPRPSKMCSTGSTAASAPPSLPLPLPSLLPPASLSLLPECAAGLLGGAAGLRSSWSSNICRKRSPAGGRAAGGWRRWQGAQGRQVRAYPGSAVLLHGHDSEGPGSAVLSLAARGTTHAGAHRKQPSAQRAPHRPPTAPPAFVSTLVWPCGPQAWPWLSFSMVVTLGARLGPGPNRRLSARRSACVSGGSLRHGAHASLA